MLDIQAYLVSRDNKRRAFDEELNGELLRLEAFDLGDESVLKLA